MKENLPLLGVQGRLEEVIWNRALKVIKAKKPGDQMGQGPVGVTGLAEGVQRASSTQTARPGTRTAEAGKLNGSQSTQRSSVISALRRQGQEYSLKSGPS